MDHYSDTCYTYDDNGRLIYKSQNKVSTIYLWDALDRLTDVYYIIDADSDIHHVQYLYNGDGERIYTITDGSLTGCLYDDGQLIAEFDNETRVTSRYLHANGIAGDVGSLVYKEELDNDSVTRSNFFYNWRGDVIDVIDGSGVVTSYRYNAFGTVVQMSGTSVNDIRFSSKRFDGNTGLSYFGARYYDASTGRFISRDPMGYIDGANQYIYCSNNPIGYIDPFGLNKRYLLNFLAQEAVGVPRGIYDFFFEEGIYDPYTGEKKSQFRRLYTNGIFTSFDAAKATADKLKADLYYNPSHGILADITQSALQKTLGRVVPGSLGRGYADTIKQYGKSNPIELFSHSQGTITQTIALEELKRRGFDFWEGSSAVFMAPVTLESRIDNISRSFPNLWYHIENNRFDFVAQTQSTVNPINHIQGWLNVADTKHQHSVMDYEYPKGVINDGYISRFYKSYPQFQTNP